jgi:hypothetical protein
MPLNGAGQGEPDAKPFERLTDEGAPQLLTLEPNAKGVGAMLAVSMGGANPLLRKPLIWL